MKIEKTELEGVKIITPQVFEDERGFFLESYSKKKFLDNKISFNFVQDNHSYNKLKYTFRGLHYQKNPMSQATLVRVISGKVLDYVVDIRKNSLTYGKFICTELSDKNFKQVLIPKGFAHGFLTLCDDVIVLYKMDQYYASQYDRILNYKDPDLKIDLGVDEKSIIIADKDKNAPLLQEIDNDFKYGDLF